MKKILKAIRRRYVMYLVNKIYVGTKHYEKKRKLLNKIGFRIGEGTRIVGPIECTGGLIVGCNCWIGKNLKINGNGAVVIGNNCNIAPEVTFQTGTHEIGDSVRRAGKGFNCCQRVGNGTWIGVRATVINHINIGNGCIVGACALVNKDVSDNTIVGGVPAREIKKLQ